MKGLDITDLIPGVPQAKLILAGVAVTAVVAVAGGLYLHGRAAGVAAEKPKVAAAQTQAATATAQGDLSAAAAAAPAAADRRALDITVHGDTAAHAVEIAPGASDALPPDVLRSWAAGVDGVRDEARAHADGSPAGQGGAEPPRPLPAS